MLGLNMHHIVRGAIQKVNSDVDGTLYISTGRTTNRGIVTPSFVAVPARLQVQATPHESLYHLNGLSYTGGLSILYAYGDLSAINRPTGGGGDLVDVRGKWWAIQHVLEWWPGWCSVSITQQLVPGQPLQDLLKLLQNGQVPTVGGNP